MNENYFQLFGIAVRFAVNADDLALRYRDLQRAAHPDRYAGASAQERLLAVQQAARINEAYRTLKEPLTRATYILHLKGVELDEADTRMDPAFLMSQMELREELGSVPSAPDPHALLDRLRNAAEQTERMLMEEISALFRQEDEQALQEIPERVRKLQFMHKLQDEISDCEDDLVHGH